MIRTCALHWSPHMLWIYILDEYISLEGNGQTCFKWFKDDIYKCCFINVYFLPNYNTYMVTSVKQTIWYFVSHVKMFKTICGTYKKKTSEKECVNILGLFHKPIIPTVWASVVKHFNDPGHIGVKIWGFFGEINILGHSHLSVKMLIYAMGPSQKHYGGNKWLK